MSVDVTAIISSSVCLPAMSHGVGMFGIQHDMALPPHLQSTYQMGPRLSTMSGNSDIEIRQRVGTDLGYGSVAHEMYRQSGPWMVPSGSVPSASVQDVSDNTPASLVRVSFPASLSFPQHSMSSSFEGLTPSISVHSGFPGSSVAAFEGRSAVLTSMQSACLDLPRSHDMPTAVPAPLHLPQLQPPAQRDACLRDEEEFAMEKQQSHASVMSAPDSFLTQQRVLRPPAHLAEVLTSAQPRALTPLPRDDPACLASLQLPLDQQPVRLLLPPPIMPPRPPPLILTSGPPSNMPIAVAAPMSVVQENASIELQPMPMLPVPTQFVMEHPPMSMHMHDVPRPGLVTEESAVKLQSSPMVRLLPPFQSDAPVHSRPALNVFLQEVPNRPPIVGRMPSLAPAGEMPVGQLNAVFDAAPRMIRPHLMCENPKSFLGINCRLIGQPLPSPELIQELPEVQSLYESQNDADLRLHDTSDHLSTQLDSEYPAPSVLPNQTREMLHESDRRFSMPAKPLMAPGQMLEALQRLPAAETRHLPAAPSWESLRADLSPLQALELRPPAEFGRVPHMTLPVVEHNDLPADGNLEQHGASFSGSTFSLRLPAPAVVMASSQIIGSRLPDDRFQSDFRYHDFDDWQEGDSSLDHRGNVSMDRIGPLSHVASTSNNISALQPSSDCTRVPSLLDENLLNLSQSGSLGQIHHRAPIPARRWKDRSGAGVVTVGELKAAMRLRDNWGRRRTFHHFSGASEDCVSMSSSYEPPSKLARSDEDTVAEAEDVPTESAGKCDGDGHDDSVTVSSSLDVASTTIAEPSSADSSTEL